MTREDLTDYETARSLFILGKMHRRVAHQLRVEANRWRRLRADYKHGGALTLIDDIRLTGRMRSNRAKAKREDDKAAFYKRAGQLALIGADALAHEAREMERFRAEVESSPWVEATPEQIAQDIRDMVQAVQPPAPPVNYDREQVARLNRRDDPADLPPGLAITRDCLNCGD